MKGLRIVLILVLFVVSNMVVGQNDSMYVMKNGFVVAQFDVNSEVDSVIFYKPTISVITDIDGNIYRTVKIGNQEWMAENLKTTKYSDGSSIPNVTSGYQWANTTSGAWSSFDNDIKKDSTYGKLYNWYVASDSRNVCPIGWHVPTNDEWILFTDYLYVNGPSGSEAIALKSTSGWNSDGNGTDNYGWNALPAGSRHSSAGDFFSRGESTNWWASDNRYSFGWSRHITHNHDIIRGYSAIPEAGFSIRCMKDNNNADNAQLPTVSTKPVNSMIGSSAVSGGDVTSNGGAPVTARGVVWSTVSNPTILDSIDNTESGLGSFKSDLTGLEEMTKYYVRAFATNSAGTVYGIEVTFTTGLGSGIQHGGGLTDVEGNTYSSVIIGTQEWLSENLKTSKYNDGIIIPHITDDTQWKDLTTGAFTNYDNDYQKDSVYGKLYNWYCVNSAKLCPTGWHLPSDTEWDTLVNYLAINGHSGYEGRALKSTFGWDYNGNGLHDYGWNGLPGGSRHTYGNYFGKGGLGYWWSNTEKDSGNSWYRGLSSGHGYIRHSIWKTEGFSVRCLKD
jgi:uncharacterized protein (TIGR02145 family)